MRWSFTCLLWVALIGCGTAPDQERDGSVADTGARDASATIDADAHPTPECPTFDEGVVSGVVVDSRATELSGLVVGRRGGDVFWAHNDSGDSARLFALSATGSLLGVYTLADAHHWDWEDLASDGTYLYIADIGDNSQIRSYVTVYVVAEPEVPDPGDGSPVEETLPVVEALELEYPDGAHDAETLLVDPITGDLYIVTKESDGEAQVYRASAPTSQFRTALQLVSALPAESTPSGDGEVTGGDIAPDGSAILLRTKKDAWLWWRLGTEGLGTTFARTGCPAPLMDEGQGEAIAFHLDGLGYTTVSEGADPPLHRFRR